LEIVIMKTTKQGVREAKQLFRMCLLDGRVDEDRARLVVQKVLQWKRRGYQTLLKHFMRFLKLEHDRHAAEIESAVPLSTDLRARVQMGLQTVYGPGLTLSFAQNPVLIGGMRIKVGTDVYDSSVRSVLAALARKFGITNSN
jgi:F-type H+-transporting ATPase subunit delta